MGTDAEDAGGVRGRLLVRQTRPSGAAPRQPKLIRPLRTTLRQVTVMLAMTAGVPTGVQSAVVVVTGLPDEL